MLQRISKILIFLPLLLSVVGARTEIHAYTYICYAFIILDILLVVFNVIKEKHYYLLIFSVGLSLLWQTTLMTDYLIGTDIHGEYYYAWQTLSNSGWDASIKHSYNASFFISALLPMISWLFKIPLEALFKGLLPVIFACVPLVVYKLGQNALDKKGAFIASMFFVMMPSYSVEIVSIGKQMIAELFFVLCFYYLIKNKVWMVCLFAILTTLAHYSLGIILIVCLTAYVLIFIVLSKIKRTTIKIKTLIGVIVLVCIASCLYLGSVASGKALRDITANLRSQTTSIEVFWDRVLPNHTEAEPSINDGANESTIHEEYGLPATITPDTKGFIGYMGNQEELVRIALGLDFAQASMWGKVFRIIQWITQILLIIGVLNISWRWKKVNSNYLAIIIVMLVLLGATVLLPGFSYMLNASRLYHITLIVLAPAFVVGGMLIFRNIKMAVLFLLIYFVFTSGAVYELINNTITTSLDLPFTYSLSGRRLDLVGFYSKNDVKVRDYAIENSFLPVYSDQWGAYLFYEKLGDQSLEYNYYPQGIRRVANRPDLTLNYDLDKVYVFITENVSEKQSVMEYLAPGVKRQWTFEQSGFDSLIAGREVAWQSGTSILYSPR